jgi:death-on-curing protein
VRDLPGLAAAYCHGLARGHPYVDGNMRIGFLAMAAFLDMNGLALNASDEEVVRVMRGVAAGVVSEAELAAWIRATVWPA